MSNHDLLKEMNKSQVTEWIDFADPELRFMEGIEGHFFTMGFIQGWRTAMNQRMKKVKDVGDKK